MRYCLRPWILVGIVVVGIGGMTFLSQASTEYLAAEQPSPKSVEEIPMPLEHQRPPDLVPIFQEHGVVVPHLVRRFPDMATFLKETRLSLNSRTYYFLRDNGDGSKSEALATGGTLRMTTGWWQGVFRVGGSVHTSQKIYGPSDRDGTRLLQTGQEGYTKWGEIFAELKFSQTGLKLYRQEYNLPFLNRNDSRMTPIVYESYKLLSLDIPRFSLLAAHTTRMLKRIDEDSTSMAEAAGAANSSNGTTTLGLLYQLSPGNSVGFVNHYTHDVLNIAYSQLDHHFPLTPDFGLRFSGQFTHQTDVGDALAGEFDTHSLGLKFSGGYRSLIASLGYTQTANRADIRSPFGGHANFASLMLGDFDRAGESVFFTGLSYDFSEWGLPGLSTFARYAWGDTDDEGATASSDQEEFDVTVDYHLNHVRNPWFRNFWLRFRAGWMTGEDFTDASGAFQSGRSRSNYRIILNYSLPLL